MGDTASLTRYLAPASFLYDFALQQYGILASPNMVDIHERNLAAFSPYYPFIGAFFFPQQLCQVAWLWKLWRQGGSAEENAMMNRFAWVYSLGNVCIGSELPFLLLPLPLPLLLFPSSLYQGLLTKARLTYSVDVLLERGQARRGERLRHHQHGGAGGLHGDAAGAFGYALDAQSPDAHCGQDVCGDRRAGSPAQYRSGVLCRGAAECAGAGGDGDWVCGGGEHERLDLRGVFGV